MAAITTSYGFYFAQPWWLLACALAAPLAWMGWRNLASTGRARRATAVVLRTLVIVLLAAILAQPTLARKGEQLAVLAVIDRSKSIPASLSESALAYLDKALASRPPSDVVGVVDVAEDAAISRLPSADSEVRRRNTTLAGSESRLSSGVDMAMAIAPPGAAVRLLLVSDGSETSGDLREAARVAASNGIPIDVLPLRYKYDREVVFRNLVAPTKARSEQTIPLRFVLESTAPASGQIVLSLNGKAVDLDPTSPAVGVHVALARGVNVHTISLPVGSRGMHEFEASFIPDDAASDSIAANNRASAITFVSGPGHVIVYDSDGKAGDAIARALRGAKIDVKHIPGGEFPSRLVDLLGCDAVVLADVDNSALTFAQQEMLCRYVTDQGGGLIMTGGPHSFGAGGWRSSPVAQILPVDMEPSQKRQLPKGALVLVMHACEMPEGNGWGKKVALAAVGALSRLDLVGVLQFGWGNGANDWVHPLSPVGDRAAVTAAINNMTMGDMPDFGAPMKEALAELRKCDAAAKHVIIISDGDPAMPQQALLDQYKEAGVTCTGVAVFPHSENDVRSLAIIAQATGGRFYNVLDPDKLPQIFIKEAQVICRSLIVEKQVQPEVTFSTSEIIRGVGGFPALEGYVLTEPRGGLAQMILATSEGEPILAAGQAGLGKCVAFTSSADSRWAQAWLQWGGFDRFWEQAVRYAGKPAQSTECEVFADVQGRQVTLTVDASDEHGRSLAMSQLAAQVIDPGLKTRDVILTQVGPGRYRGQFDAVAGGSHMVNISYRKGGGEGGTGIISTCVSVPYAPEFASLSDNFPLLAEVASISGGRVIQGDPAKAAIFERSGAKFPRSATPLAPLLLQIWLGLFLLDVAVRRVAVDWAAMLRRVSSWVGRLRSAPAVDATVERLRRRREKFAGDLASTRSALAAARFEAPADLKSPPQPTVDSSSAAQTPPPDDKAKPAPQAQTPPPKPQDTSHLSQLLQAKRRARKDARGRDDSPTTGDKP